MARTKPTTEDANLDPEVAKAAKTLAAADYTSLVEQVKSEYAMAYWFLKPKWNEWAVRLKLYNNQRRDRTAVGDPTMFAIHQTVLAALYDDRLSVEFGVRKDGDEDAVDMLNAAAEFDYDEMGKDVLDYEYDFDATAFGRGIMLMSDFDRRRMVPVPEVIDPIGFFRDPNAKSANGNARSMGALGFWGREIRTTKRQLKAIGGYSGYERLKSEGTDVSDVIDQYGRLRNEAQGLGDVSHYTTVGDNADFRVLEWYTHWKGSKVRVCLAGRARDKVVLFQKLDAGDWPLIDRPIYPIAHDWDGVSVWDMTEDKQRARAVVTNLGLQGVKVGLHTRFLFNSNLVKERAALENQSQEQYVPVKGSPVNAILPIEHPGLKQEVGWILQALDTSAQKATASPDIQQGIVSDSRRTFGEIGLAANKADTRYSLSARVFGWSERRIWARWAKLYDINFKDGIDRKLVRLGGALGPKVRELKRGDMIPSVAPDVKVESRTVADSRRSEELSRLRLVVKDAMAMGQQFDKRYYLKREARLAGMTRATIDQLFPQTPDELLAEDENLKMEKGTKVPVRTSDDDMQHIQVHAKLAGNALADAHVASHKRNMMLKKARPELAPQAENPAEQQAASGVMESAQSAQPMAAKILGA